MEKRFYLVMNSGMCSRPSGDRFATREEAQAEADRRNRLHYDGPKVRYHVAEIPQ